MDVDENQVLLLKKKLKIIKQYKGQGTQLISLYLPPDADRSSVMKQLTDDSALRHQLSQAGLKRAAQFSWSRAAVQTLEILKKSHG